MMMKRLSATALLVISAAACRSNDKASTETPAQPEVPSSYPAKVVDVREIEFLTPAERDAQLGLDWRSNRAISQHLTPDVPVELDMSRNREIVLNYEKQFALTVKAVSARGQGTVSIGSKWAKVGDVIDFEALEDSGARFTGWEGDVEGEGVKIDGKKISVKMDRPRNIRAVFAATKADLSFVGEFGAPKGGGIYELGQEVEWSVTSPWPVSEGVQMVAATPSGKIKLDADAKADPGWKRQVRIAASSANIVSGSTQGSDGWVDADSEISVNAVPADESYGFIKWEGVPSELAALNPLKMKADKPLSPVAVFEKQKFRLAVLTEFGKVSGDGLHPKDKPATWSVESPVEIAPGIRKVARNAGGTVTMNTNKTYRIDWDTEVLLEVIKKTAASETVVRSEWVPVGKMIKGISVDRSKEEAAPLWEGSVERSLAREESLNLKMDRPRRLVANFTPEPSTLLATDSAGAVLVEKKTFKPEDAKEVIPGTQYVSAVERGVLVRSELEKQLDKGDKIAASERDILEGQPARIDTGVAFAGWKNCVRMRNEYAQLIIAPDIGRVVYFGSPDDRSNLLWLNEDLKGKTFSRDDAAKAYNDVGGSRVNVAPAEVVLPLTGKAFPQPYEIDGSACKVILGANKVVTQTYPEKAVGCFVERSFVLKKNKLYVHTALVGTSDLKHDYSVGPQTFTQFIRPQKVLFGRSEDRVNHPAGYAVLKGTAPEIVKDDEGRMAFAFPEQAASEWRIGTYSDYIQMEFKDFIVTAKAIYKKGEEFNESNTNLQLYCPESPVDCVEIGQTGSLAKLSKDSQTTSEIVWILEKR
ncbi:MAG: hypothetical protein RL095_1009 [Verrucomicrobiota bacterium]|jgi:hypothetical protein